VQDHRRRVQNRPSQLRARHGRAEKSQKHDEKVKTLEKKNTKTDKLGIMRNATTAQSARETKASKCAWILEAQLSHHKHPKQTKKNQQKSESTNKKRAWNSAECDTAQTSDTYQAQSAWKLKREMASHRS
jgi:hypothetical protein